MKRILLLHGPNLNQLGQRNPELYGSLTLNTIVDLVNATIAGQQYQVLAFQSNHEGALIDFIQEHHNDADGIIINPGALTHYSYALHDALVDAQLPTVEVHLSDIYQREEWRRHSVIAPACIAQISGKKEQGYVEAARVLLQQMITNV